MDYLAGTPEDKLEEFLTFNSVDPVELNSENDNADISSILEEMKKPIVSTPYTIFPKIETPDLSDKGTEIKIPEKPVDELEEKDFNYHNLPHSKKKVVDSIQKLGIDSNYKQYLLKLAKKESDFNPRVVNQYGYAGLYQFQKPALDSVNISKKDYMNNVDIQHIAALKLADMNFKILRPYHNLIGTKIKGITITKFGLMGAAHLVGAGNVIKFLRSKGDFDKKDGNGTKCSTYLKYFSDIT